MNNKAHNEGINPILQNASELMKTYRCAAKVNTKIYDTNYHPLDENISEKENSCAFCEKYNKSCNNLHINAIRESHIMGGSNAYNCDLGILFWTSPLYQDDNFIGALCASGLQTDKKEECMDKMSIICNKSLDKKELSKITDTLPFVDNDKTGALSELLLLCAVSLSERSEGCHAALKKKALNKAELSEKIEELKNKNNAGNYSFEYSIEKEKLLVQAMKSGNTAEARHILNDILANLIAGGSPKSFKFMQYRAIELAILLSRAARDPALNERMALADNNAYIRAIQDAVNVDELSRILYRMTEELGNQIQDFQGINHSSALKRAKYFLMENFTRKISLEEIASASGFSAPYFSTIFKEEVGENLSSYLNRLRVEKAKIMLRESNYALSEIARSCGFEDQSWFSKIFRHFTGISPGKYRNQGRNSPGTLESCS